MKELLTIEQIRKRTDRNFAKGRVKFYKNEDNEVRNDDGGEDEEDDNEDDDHDGQDDEMVEFFLEFRNLLLLFYKKLGEGPGSSSWGAP